LEPVPFEFVTVEEARQVLDGEPPAHAGTDWEAVRNPLSPEAQMLTAPAVRWLASLPMEVRPMELCGRYPRIGNQIAALWPDRAACLAWLADLLIDRRGGRQGFPGGIAPEIHRLQDYLFGLMSDDA